MEKTQNNNSKNIIIFLLLAGLIGALVYIWYNKTKEKETEQRNAQVVAQKITENEDLNAAFNQSVAKFDSLKTNSDSEMTMKNGEIGKLNMEISNLKGEISGLLNEKSKRKFTDEENKKLTAKINELNQKIADYANRVAKLEEDNKALTEENTTVKTNLQQKETELASTKTTLDQTQTEKQNLESKVDVGQTLTASNIYLSGINEKSGGKEKETTTAKRVDKLRIGFDLEPNRIATSGKKDIYVCVTAPDGTPVSVEALGSGTFTTREEGNKFYTNKIEVDYTQGQRKNINFDWKQNSDFQRGDYKVEVYQNGFKIGESKVTFKKGGLFG
jgi:hypothetical protein